MSHPNRISPMGSILVLVLGAGCSCGAPRTTIPEYRAPRASAVVIDGQLSEWSGVPETEAFVGTMDGSPGYVSVRAQLMWDEQGLYVAARVPDAFLVSTNRDRDDHLWEEDCLELMIDRDGEGADARGLGEGYVELQISPRNVVFDTWFDSYRAPPPFGHVDWTSGIETAVVLHGTPDDTANDEGYDVEARIPWTALATPANASLPAPHAGDTIRVAIYVLDTLNGGGQGAVAWSAPMVGDFHVPARMGRVVLVE